MSVIIDSNLDFQCTVDVKPHSVYANGPYFESFGKLYKGIIVTVSMNGVNDPAYVRLSIRTIKAKTCIWKRPCEKMNSLTFTDDSCTIFCDYEQDPKNQSLKTLSFDKVVYNELKMFIPTFMEKQGCMPKQTIKSENELKLVF